MSHIVLNPRTSEVIKELQFCINKWHDVLKTVDTDVRIIKNEYDEPIALVPRIHMTFKDGSDYLRELSGEGEQHHVH